MSGGARTWPRLEYHCLLVTPRGTLLVLVNVRFGGWCSILAHPFGRTTVWSVQATGKRGCRGTTDFPWHKLRVQSRYQNPPPCLATGLCMSLMVSVVDEGHVVGSCNPRCRSSITLGALDDAIGSGFASTSCRCTSSTKPEANPQIGADPVQRVVGCAGAPTPHGPGDPPPCCCAPPSGTRGGLCQTDGVASPPLGKADVLVASRARLLAAIHRGQRVCNLPRPRTVPWHG